MTPRSIAEVARDKHLQPEMPLWKPLGEFLDSFYDHPSEDAFAQEPAHQISEQDAAYLAGAVEYLCAVYNLNAPSWISGVKYFLDTAYWPNVRGRSQEVLCLAESPTAFRKRFVFVEGRPLRRKKGPREPLLERA